MLIALAIRKNDINRFWVNNIFFSPSSFGPYIYLFLNKALGKSPEEMKYSVSQWLISAEM